MNRMFVSLPQNLHVEALTLSMAIFGDGTSKEVIKVVWGHEDGNVIL